MLCTEPLHSKGAHQYAVPSQSTVVRPPRHVSLGRLHFPNPTNQIHHFARRRQRMDLLTLMTRYLETQPEGLNLRVQIAPSTFFSHSQASLFYYSPTASPTNLFPRQVSGSAASLFYHFLRGNLRSNVLRMQTTRASTSGCQPVAARQRHALQDAPPQGFYRPQAVDCRRAAANSYLILRRRDEPFADLRDDWRDCRSSATCHSLRIRSN